MLTILSLNDTRLATYRLTVDVDAPFGKVVYVTIIKEIVCEVCFSF